MLNRLKLTWPGPGLQYSLHNHSIMSDGAGTLKEVCLAGKAAGIRVLGIADHWVIPPIPGTDADTWRMPPAKLPEYVQTLLQLRSEFEDEKFQLKIGLEVDYFFENFREVLAELEKYPIDYLIGSVHYAGSFPIDYSAETWKPLSRQRMDDICEEYWRKLEGAASCGAFTFLGHLDLPKKFGFIDNGKYLDHACRVLDAAQTNGTGIELNTSGWFKPCAEPYPCQAMLKEAVKRHIPVIVNADAHSPAHLNRSFGEAEQYLINAGYPRQGAEK